MNIFHHVFQRLKYCHLKTWKISMMYTRGKECTEKFYESLREHANKVINFEKEKMKLLTKEQKK